VNLRQAQRTIEKMYEAFSRKCQNIKWYRDRIERVYWMLKHAPPGMKHCPKCELKKALDSNRR
jgi:hypothetical protein